MKRTDVDGNRLAPSPAQLEHDFASRMQDLAPFESSPHLAVAVSGGADSMALALLAHLWATGRGGRITALTVDHGLRPESADEALLVAGRLAAQGIPCQVLAWRGKKPDAGIQEAARNARHALLSEWCRENGILHLLFAHHLEDQAETFLLRLARGSGIDGLAAMSAVVETPDVRILRPLLATPREHLRQFLSCRGERWIEDPSNENTEFARVRVRQEMKSLAPLGLSPDTLVDSSRRMARARVALETSASRALAVTTALSPLGFASLDLEKLFQEPDEISLKALSRVLMCVGGHVYPPGLNKLERLHEELKTLDGKNGSTLAGCRLMTGKKNRLLICREERGLPAPLLMQPGETVFWDRRFAVTVKNVKGKGWDNCQLRPLGAEGWKAIRRDKPQLRNTGYPSIVRNVLPALWDDRGVIAVEHLNYRRNAVNPGIKAVFQPRQTLSGAGFVVAE